MRISRLSSLCALSLPLFPEPAFAQTGYAIHRIGSFSTPGDLLCVDLANPDQGKWVGNIGLGNVGTMDFLGDELWLVSGDNNALTFYTLDINTASPTYESSFDGPFGGASVFSGSFDDEGYYWVSDFANDVIRKLDPQTGESLHAIPMPADVGFNGLAFVDRTLYAARGATGDPPQLFGTIDLQSGAFRTIGRTFVGVGGNGGGNGTGALDYDEESGTLYLVYRSGIAAGQFWSLYTVDLQTGEATFMGEMQPERNIDAFAVPPSSFRKRLALQSSARLVHCLRGPAELVVGGSCVELESGLSNDLRMDMRDVQLFMNGPRAGFECVSAAQRP